MHIVRGPLLPIGLLLVILGFGNWYTGVDKGSEYEELLETGNLPSVTQDFDGFEELDAHLNTTLLSSLQRGHDHSTLVNAKLDFYKVVQSGGRVLVVIGLFCAAAGLIHAWYRQRLAERTPRSPAA
jgi:hypothetical protein